MLMRAPQQTDDRPPRGSLRLVRRLLEIRDEYLNGRGMRKEAAWDEAMAALRELDRRNEARGRR